MPSYYELIKQSKLAGGSGGGPQPILVPKLAIENGTYYPVDDEADGYSSVTVNVPDVNDIAFVPPQKFKSDGSALADYKIYGSNGVKTENKTAVLPLTFTAKAGNAVDWEIEGNDDNGTEQLFPFADINFSYRYGQTDLHIWSDSGKLFMQGIVYETSTAAQTWKDYLSFTLPAGTYACNTISTLQYGFTIGRYIKKKSDNSNILGADSTSFTIAEETEVYLSFYIFNATISTATQITVTLIVGSTAPDHYIPYQQGVGERTANLVDVSTEAKITIPTTSAQRYAVLSDVLSAGIYCLTYKVGNAGTAATLSYRVRHDGEWSGYVGTSYVYGVSTTTITVAEGDQILIYNGTNDSYSIANGKEVDVMLIKGSTAPTTYIPYGYQIPIIVSQDGQTDKTVDIYIGDSPLTEGETVSKTSTGIDIELFEGENTVSTTLYNKPEMAITYSIATGVGEEVSGSYRIPVTINSTTTNVPIGDTPLIEDEYVSYAEQKIYKYVDSVLTPVDPPSALPQISTANGENKLSIETEVQPDLVDVALLTPIELIPVALGTKTISVNDTYDASDDSLDGYSSVVVNVPSPPAPVLISKSITENGTYAAASDEADGYSEVTVNIRSYSEVLDQGLQATLQEEE